MSRWMIPAVLVALAAAACGPTRRCDPTDRNATCEDETPVPDAGEGTPDAGQETPDAGSEPPDAGDGLCTYEERFTQGAGGRIDLLFVIDDSGSMMEEQAAIAAEAETFVSTLDKAGADYQLAIVTTDVSSFNDGGGRLEGDPRIVRAPDAASAFAANVRQVGTFGSGDEQGLEAMRRALSAPLVTADNAGFLRPDADLAVIVVSDEDDSSPGTASDYATFLDGLKGSAGRTALHALVGDAPIGCEGLGGSAVAGTRYLDVAALTGGRTFSICANDAERLAAEIAAGSAGLASSFPLPRDAAAPTIVVRVSNVVVDASSWSWDPAARRVVFAPASIPDANAAVRITYRAACD